jgi:transglutaminase superfamily protein
VSAWTVSSEDATLSPLQKAGLAAEIIITYPRIRWLLWRHDLPSAVAAVRDPAGAGTPPAEALTSSSHRHGRRLGRAVSRTLALLPADSRCLVRSLVLLALLARRGIRSQLVIGAMQGPDFEAHAWVEFDGSPLLPAGVEYGRLVEL